MKLHRRRPGSPGFTLIELLCVLIVLALAASLGVGAIGSTAGVHAAHLAELTTRGMLERTRLLANGRGGATLQLGHFLVATPNENETSTSGTIEFRAALPRGWSAHRADNDAYESGMDDSTVRFAPDGTCDDLTMRLDGPQEQSRTLRVLGLSGQVIVLQEGDRR